MGSVKGWRYAPGRKAIVTKLKMKHFMAVVMAIQKIAKLAEKADHHPDIHLTGYRHLKLVLSSHDVGKVTERDFRLALEINRILAKSR